MQEVLDLLSSIKHLPDELVIFLVKNLKRRVVKKGEYLLKPGEVSNKIYFIETGLFRGYEEINSATKNSIWFMIGGDVMFGVSSWYSQLPSQEGIEALEDSIVWYITYEQLELLYEEFISFNYNGRILTQKYYALTFDSQKRLRMITAEERYDDYLLKWPHLAKRICPIYLASFLGMSVETLYKIRGKGKGKK